MTVVPMQKAAILAHQDYKNEILLANAEAHRFAITYHRKRSRKNLGIL